MVATPREKTFSKRDFVWAVVCASAILAFSYTMLLWFDIEGVPYLFEPGSGYTILLRALSLCVVMACWVFYPSKHR